MGKLTHNDLPQLEEGQRVIYIAGSGDSHCHGLARVVEKGVHSVKIELLQIWNQGKALSRSSGQTICASPCELERF